MTPESEPDYEYEQDLKDHIRALQAALDAERAKTQEQANARWASERFRAEDAASHLDEANELRRQLAEARSALQACRGVLSKTRALLPHYMPASQRNEVFGGAVLEIEKLLAPPSPARPQE